MNLPILNSKFLNSDSITELTRFSEVKKLCDNIDHFFLKNSKETVSLSIHSWFQREGKTLFSLSLGVSLAKYFEKRVLIVDAAHEGQFLRSMVVDELSDDEIVCKTFFEKLDIVHLSQLNVHEYQIDSFVESFSEEYDVILFDTVSLGKNNINNLDPFAIAKRADKRLMVTSALSSSLSQLDRIATEFKKGGLHIDGAIFNEGAPLG